MPVNTSIKRRVELWRPSGEGVGGVDRCGKCGLRGAAVGVDSCADSCSLPTYASVPTRARPPGLSVARETVSAGASRRLWWDASGCRRVSSRDADKAGTGCASSTGRTEDHRLDHDRHCRVCARRCFNVRAVKQASEQASGRSAPSCAGPESATPGIAGSRLVRAPVRGRGVRRG